MTNKNAFENELDAIRIALHEETKGMTVDERIAYLRSKTEPFMQLHGIKTIKRANDGKSKSPSGIRRLN